MKPLNSLGENVCTMYMNSWLDKQGESFKIKQCGEGVTIQDSKNNI